MLEIPVFIPLLNLSSKLRFPAVPRSSGLRVLKNPSISGLQLNREVVKLSVFCFLVVSGALRTGQKCPTGCSFHYLFLYDANVLNSSVLT